MTGVLIVALATGLYARQSHIDGVQSVLALALGVVILVGAVAYGLWVARTSNARAVARGMRLTEAFRSIAGRMGLRDPAPGVGVKQPPPPDPTGYGVAFYPTLSGTYRGHGISVGAFSPYSGDDDRDDHLKVLIRAPRQMQWPTARRLDRGNVPPGLSGEAREALERLKQRKGAGREIEWIEVERDALSCVLADRITDAVDVEAAKIGRALPDRKALEAIIDDLVIVADGLPPLRP